MRDIATVAAVSAGAGATLTTLATGDIACAHDTAGGAAAIAGATRACAAVRVSTGATATETATAGIALADRGTRGIATLRSGTGHRLANGRIPNGIAGGVAAVPGAAGGGSAAPTGSTGAIATGGIPAAHTAAGRIATGRGEATGPGAAGCGRAIATIGARNREKCGSVCGGLGKQIAVDATGAGLVLALPSRFGRSVATGNNATGSRAAICNARRGVATTGVTALGGRAEAISAGMAAPGGYRRRVIPDDGRCID